VIRPATVSDFNAILAVVNDAPQAFRAFIPDEDWHDPYFPAEELASEIAAGVRFWVWEDAVEIVGVMGIQDVRDMTLIRHAYVRTGRQREGIGGQLLEHLLALAERPVLVGTWADATWAVRFYERHRFRLVTPEEKDWLLREYWDIPERQVETSVVLARAEG
jgi:N-acetylglutamate synthase-like GNAT family acetyltransferase